MHVSIRFLASAAGAFLGAMTAYNSDFGTYIVPEVVVEYFGEEAINVTLVFVWLGALSGAITGWISTAPYR